MPENRDRLERIDRMIDALNADRAPLPPRDDEEAELLATARLVKSLRLSGEEPTPVPVRVPRHGQIRRRKTKLLVPVIVVAAILLLVLSLPSALLKRDPVAAMERAATELKTYHAVLEKRVENAQGDTWLVRRVEIWQDGDRYMTVDDRGMKTVNDGERKWQVDPQARQVNLIPPLPDQRGFDLHEEVERALRYPHEIIGEEPVAGRNTVHLRISPPGGLPYDLWIDTATNLPLQLRWPMQNALQTTYTFTHFAANVAIDADLFVYDVPDGYEEVQDDAGQWVDTPWDAVKITGFEPLIPDDMPQRILATPDQIVFDYGDTIVIQIPASGGFSPEPNAALGTAGDGILEVLWDRLRWQQDGLQIEVQGPRAEEIARQLDPDLTMPDPARNLSSQAEIPVPVDLEMARRDQRQVDAGHSPWQLDPRQVAAVFAYTTFGAEHYGDQPPFDTSVIITNTGSEAVVEWATGPVARVYLQRLIRTDETGIWSVVGYDPR